jgi:hypothetical protein
MVRKVSITTDAVVVRKIGELLYGDRWQRPLARAAGISQSLEKTPHGVVVWLVGSGCRRSIGKPRTWPSSPRQMATAW